MDNKGRIRDELMRLILMYGFNGISNIIWVEDLKMMKDKEKGGNV